MKNKLRLTGKVTAVVRGPDGKVKQRLVTHNLVTEQGDFFAAQAIYSASYNGAGWGMKLGRANTTPTKTGAASFINTTDYVTTSAQALDDSTPKAGATDDIVQWRRLFAATEGTEAAIRRVCIVDNTTNAGEADATGTYAIAVFAGDINKGAADTLTVTWDVTYLGA